MSDQKKNKDLMDFSGWEGKTVVVKPATLEEAFDNLKKRFSCRDCGGPMHYQYYKKVDMKMNEFTWTDFVHDYYLCKECYKK